VFRGDGIERELIFHGAGSADHWIKGQVIGCRELVTTTGTQILRRPKIIFLGQLGTRTGVAGMDIGTGQRFVDNITIVSDYTPGSGARAVNVADGIATLSFDARGDEWHEVELVGGTGAGTGTGATDANGAWAAL
jgi:hypothetical protein